MQLLQQSRNLEFLSITSIYNVGVLPPNKRDEVCSAFVNVVDRENKHSSVQTSGAAESENEQDDYGYRY